MRSRLNRVSILLSVLLPIGISVLLSGAIRHAHASGPLTAWNSTGSMGTPRLSHTATLLNDGRVLVVGGNDNGGANQSSAILNTCEIYDPSTGAWTPTGSMGQARFLHTATLLNDGRVLIAGGADFVSLNSAELYDPATGLWTTTGSMNVPRHYHTATLLANGKVLVVGGSNYDGVGGSDSETAELYDPTTGTWSFTGSMVSGGGESSQRYAHVATLLNTGEVLIAGGGHFNGSTTPLDQTAELYDPTTGLWSLTGSMTTVRAFPSLALLPNGQVLVTGGGVVAGTNTATNVAELYDRTTGLWTATGTMNGARTGQTMTTLLDGTVLAVGGSDFSNALSRVELYDPTTGLWNVTSAITTARFGHTATLLAGGAVLVAGGFDGSTMFDSAELYQGTPVITWTNPADITYGTALTSTQLNATASVPGTFTYNPSAGTVLSAGSAQTLSVTFTPDDTTTYSSASREVTINVSKRDATWTTNSNSKLYGAVDPNPLTSGSGDFLTSDGVTARYSRVAGETVSGSPYHITASLSATVQGVLNNYNIANTGANFNILKASTSTVVNSSQNPSAYGQQITLTAAVSPVAPGGGAATGSVQFFDNAASLGTRPLTGGIASLSISTFPSGSHSITATYPGDGNFSGSTSPTFVQTVTKSTTTTSLTGSPSPSRFGQTVTFTATVADGFTTPTGNVEFLDGIASLGSVTLKNGVAVFTISTFTVGSHSITARYAETRNFLGSTSAPFTQNVIKSDTATAVDSSAKNNTSQFGKSVTFTAIVTASSPGGGTPSGIVQFYDGATLVSTQTLTKGQAKLTTSSLSRGSHSIKSVYTGDAGFNASTSPVLIQHVN